MAGSEEQQEPPLTREAFERTVRLVSSARLRDAVMSPLADDEEELALLAEIEGATSSRLIAEERGTGGVSPDELVHGVPHAKFINASFAYAKPRDPNRFNPADRGAWYAALDVETSIAEVGVHLTQALADAGDFNAVVEYGEMIASMSGVFVDLRDMPDHPALNPNKEEGYAVGNALAAKARGEGHNGIIYPSVRHAGGTCIAALWPNVVQSVVQGEMYRLIWNGSADFEVRGL
ncbi:MAG: RES family NAD+ phosphorylase [Erythrobacter sp.]|uniref:RES family NAD+ phosphorylase n=1 Tax=Erythrobacter sp. TaxID=1042 RepID=UPI0026104206|nr:RES family NAD+ phosphorylase [Erythrobacter sp.]MDJ0977297.1 RES family NAD+ phosphorylase [Erythrobacter sp.]